LVNIESTITSLARIKLVIPGVLQAFRGDEFNIVDMRADPLYAPHESFFALYKPSVHESMDLVAHLKSRPSSYVAQDYLNELVKYGVPEEVEELLDNARFMEAYRTYTHYNKNGFGVELRGNKVHVIEVEMDHEISNVMRESWGV
jgi:hypothetical protein